MLVATIGSIHLSVQSVTHGNLHQDLALQSTEVSRTLCKYLVYLIVGLLNVVTSTNWAINNCNAEVPRFVVQQLASIILIVM